MSDDPERDEGNALDVLEELVAERYPKGTSDPFGKALRHQLHKLGKLNVPDIRPVNAELKALANHLLVVADTPAYRHVAEGGQAFTDERGDLAARQKLADLVFTVLYSETPGYLYRMAGSDRTGALKPKGYDDRKRSLYTWSFGPWRRSW